MNNCPNCNTKDDGTGICPNCKAIISEQEVVNYVYLLESKCVSLNNDIASKNEEIQDFESRPYIVKPPEPELEKAEKPPYPPVCPKIFPATKICWVVTGIVAALAFILFISIEYAFTGLFLGILVLPICLFFTWDVSKYCDKYEKQEIERLKNTPEYKEACYKIDEETAARQAILYKKYTKEKKEYDEVLIPRYESRLAEEQDRRAKKIQSLTDEREAIQKEYYKFFKALQQAYEDTKIVPTAYRSPDILLAILDILNSSNLDVKEAMAMYDRNKQMAIDSARLQAQNEANYQAQVQNNMLQQQAYLMQEQNALINEQNSIADQARRDANMAAAISTVQHHNTNKMLKNLSK